MFEDVVNARESIRNRVKFLGMQFKFLKLKNNLLGKNINYYPSFYKYTVYKGNPLIHSNVAIERMLIPWNKKSTNTAEIKKFLRDLIPTLGTPNTSLIPFYLYYAHINNILRSSEMTQFTVMDSIKLHGKVFNKLKQKPQLLKYFYKWREKNVLRGSIKGRSKKNISRRKHRIKIFSSSKSISKIFS